MKVLLAVFFTCFAGILSAQDTGSIIGLISDKEVNNEPLAFANVLIKNTTKGATSDFDGNYEIANVDPGTYILVFSFLGYENLEIADIVVEAGKETVVNAALGAGSVSLDEVVLVQSTREDSEVALLLKQKNALLMQEAISAEALSIKGISDAADAVVQISGISKQEGSGNVYVRGLGDRYQNTTMNNLSLPSNDVDKKNINLDLFSSSIIENIAVSKAYSSLLYGDFGAGNVNISSKDYTGDGYLQVSLGTNLNTNAAGIEFVRNEGPSHFGFYNRYNNNPFAVVLSHGVDPESAWDPIGYSGTIEGGFSKNFNNGGRLSFFSTLGFDSSYALLEGPARDFTNVLKIEFPNVQEYAYSTTTTIMGNLGYRINADHKLSFNSLFINSSTDAVGYYGIEGFGTNRDAIINTDEGFYVMNAQFNQNMIFVNQILGEHTFDGITLSWGSGYNQVFADEPDRKRITLENFQLSLDGDPLTNPVFYTNIPFDNQRYFQNIQDEELNSFVDLRFSIDDNLQLIAGYNGRYKKRNFSSIRYGYEILDRDNTPVKDASNLNEIFDYRNLNIPDGTGLFDLIVLNPINNDIGNRNRPGLPENIYEGRLGIHGLYINSEYQAGDKWTFIPGIRVEFLNQKITYDVINIRPDDPGFRNVNENIFLPHFNVKYSHTEKTNWRLAISKTVSFPEFKEVAPFVYESVTQRVGGNPDLLGGLDQSGPSYSDILNLDLKYEWFPERSELFSIAGFYKAIKDPVNRVVAADATGTQRYFRTGDVARIIGVEFEGRKDLIVDEEDKTVLSLGLNAAFTHTRQDLRDIPAGTSNTFGTTFDRDRDRMEGASPFILNADLNYNPSIGTLNPRATLNFSYFSDRISSLGAGSLGNIVEKAIPYLNFNFSGTISSKLKVNLSFKNILNPDITLTRENTGIGDVVIREYKLGTNLGLSLNYTLN